MRLRGRIFLISWSLALSVLTAFVLMREAASENELQEDLNQASDERLVAMFLSTNAEVNAAGLSKVQSILEQRAFKYANERRNEDAERLMRLVMPVFQGASVDERRRQSALEVLGPFLQGFGKIPDAAVERLGWILVNDPSAPIRDRVATMLCGSIRPAAIPFLKTAAFDERNLPEWRPGHSVRQSVMQALESFERSVPDVAAALQEIRSSEVSSRAQVDEAIRLRAQSGDADALPELLTIIETGDDERMRSVILGLGVGLNKYPEEARAVIMDVLQAGLQHPNAARRQASCTAMQHTGEFRLISRIKPLVDDPAVRPYAQLAIIRLESDMNQFRQGLGIPDEERNMSIEQALRAKSQDAHWMTHALRLRLDLADDATRKQIYEALAGFVIDQLALPADQRSGGASNAMSILSHEREHRGDAVQAVLKVLAAAGEKDLARQQCYMALGYLGGQQASQALKEAVLKAPRYGFIESEEYMDLCGFLSWCGPEAAPVLLQNNEELDREGKSRLYGALGRTGNEIVVPYLLDEARAARAERDFMLLASALGTAFDKADKYTPDTRQRIANALVENAGSADLYVRSAVARGLGEVGDSTHIPLLEKMKAPFTIKSYFTGVYAKSNEMLRKEADASIETIRRRLAQKEIPTQELMHKENVQTMDKTEKEAQSAAAVSRQSGVPLNELKGYRWKPMWVSHIGSLKGAADYLGVEVSTPWLFGVTGYAFLLNIHETLCPSGWHVVGIPLDDGARNAGLVIEHLVDPDHVTEPKAELQQRAWEGTRKAIDDGKPCYGYDFEVGDYYAVYGYDDTGYYYSGVRCDNGKGPMSWKDYGTKGVVGIIYINAVSKGEPADDSKAVRDALLVALNERDKVEGASELYACGLAGYDRWVRSIESGKADGFGMAYNAQCYAECRKNAVDFLKEAKGRVDEKLAPLFDEAIGHYGPVAENLRKVADTFPFFDRKPEHIQDESRKRTAIEALKAAKAEETKGLDVLAKITKALGAEGP